MNANGRLLTIGLVGTLVTAICCFTPVLLIALASLGLAGWAAGLDLVLLPALAGFVLLSLYALVRRGRVA